MGERRRRGARRRRVACERSAREGWDIRIENLREDRRNGTSRVCADVVWEDRRQATQELWFESPDEDAGLACDPQAFLCAVAAPALAYGERRIRVEGAVSPRLRDGIATVLATLVGWRRPTRRAPRIEATGDFVPRRPAEDAGASLMLSGGLDSLALLRKNRLDLPLDHPRSHATAFFVHGFDLADDPATCEVYRVAVRGLEAVAEDASLRLIRIGSNLRMLGSRWGQEHQSGAMAAVGHACSDRARELEIASSYTWETLFPYGSHPVLDLHYSGDDLTVRHADLERGRLAKAAMLGDWPAGLAALRVCWEGDPPEGFVNCGVCHKCVLTLLELEAAGCLARCPSFPVQEVTPELAERLKAVQRTSIPFFAELVEPLERRGRGDLAAVLRRKLAGIETHLARQARGPWWKRPFVRRRT